MKTSRLAALAAVSFAALAATSHAEEIPEVDPPKPQGALSAFPTIVQTGAHPTLNWSIIHPARIYNPPPPGGGGSSGGGSSGGGSSGGGSSSGGSTGGSKDIAIISPPGTIIPTEDVFVTVQIIGSGPTDCSSLNKATKPPTDLRLSLDGGSYTQLFYGTQDDVDPSHELYIKKVRAGQSVNLGGRYVLNGAWTPFVTTRNANLQVVTLVNGDLFPGSTKFQGQAGIAPYLKPYLDSSNRIRIGPLSALVVMELAQSNHSSPCFDYQDQVVLVTISRKHPNNGHGNNLDGVDVSNPGNGSGGPNGQVDPSGDYDDEMR